MLCRQMVTSQQVFRLCRCTHVLGTRTGKKSVFQLVMSAINVDETQVFGIFLGMPLLFGNLLFPTSGLTEIDLSHSADHIQPR